MNQTLSQIAEVNGQKLTLPQVRLLAKLESHGVKLPDASQSRTNPFTGARHTLEPLAVALYDFILEAQTRNRIGRDVTVQTFDRARFLFLAFWPKTYSEMLD